MDQSLKTKILADAEREVGDVVKKVKVEMPRAEQNLDRARQELRGAKSPSDLAVRKEVLAIYTTNSEALRNATDSPYFSRCDITAEGGESKTLYFGKFSIPEFGIYSWISPASKIRFGDPGRFSYQIADHEEIHGVLRRNDQYLIAEGNIVFMATTTAETPRTLIYQKYFSNRKSAFMLPEIVERMERAQDDVIRAAYHGSFLISGPAGSGKTTLALHRVAYLLQSPEVADKFNAENILVLVQDDSTKKYFEELLPSLGIRGVAITTFASWALAQLDLATLGFVSRYGQSEAERDSYEFAKNAGLKTSAGSEFHKGKPFNSLGKAYASHFSPELQKLFEKQKKEKVLDRFDLTILLAAKIQKEGALTKKEKVYDEYVTGVARFKWMTVPVKYSLTLLDEVQNYLPEQIKIVKSCIASTTSAMTYVGDLAQQTSLFTLRDWNTIGESFERGRIVKLDKVYRSTRQILEYIRSAGFAVEIPDGVREGKAVEEITHDRMSEIIKNNTKVQIGILGLSPEDVAPYASLASEWVRVMTVNHAQGVEFEVVIFVGGPADLSGYPKAIIPEKQKILKDQVYVGLTRAMSELYVVKMNDKRSHALLSRQQDLTS
jgi:DNA helicase IV